MFGKDKYQANSQRRRLELRPTLYPTPHHLGRRGPTPVTRLRSLGSEVGLRGRASQWLSSFFAHT
jgi:hypothetical protein